MDFYKDQLFHIYNQGNNRRPIFIIEDNYEFFLWKMKAYLIPFGDFIAWCLMPNHFHWLFYVERLTIPRKEFRTYVDQIEFQRRKKKYGSKARKVERHNLRTAEENTLISLSESIGILERTYSQAINRQEDWTGSLFRSKCKAKDGFIGEVVTATKYGREDYKFSMDNDYGFNCFRYIHGNPLEAGIVKREIDYKWSSAISYAGLRKNPLCNITLGKQLFDWPENFNLYQDQIA